MLLWSVTDCSFCFFLLSYYIDFAAYLNATGNLSPNIVKWESQDVQNIVFRTPHMYLVGRTCMEVREIASGRLVQLIAAPRSIKLSWEGRPAEGNPSNLNMHVIVADKSNDNNHRDDFFTLGSPPYTLLRLRRR